MIKEITKYMTEDNEEHWTHDQAEEWEARVDRLEMANIALEQGEPLLQVLGILNVTCPPELLNVTKNTGISIPHWQCRDEPGYKIKAITMDHKLFVWGHAGSWSGPYGRNVSLEDLADDVRQMNRRNNDH